MPLPSGGTTWPPREQQPIYDQYAIWDAWYSGNVDDLATAYGDNSVPRIINRPSQFRGGLLGTISRWFWGAPTPAGERRTKLHVPLAADIASTSADLLYSEPVKIVVEDQHAQQRLDLIAEHLHAVLIEQAEVGSALSGAYLRICWDPKTQKMPWIDAIHADAALPEWQWGRLKAVTFWRCIEDDGTIYRRHLERHEPGVIYHGLYEGGINALGAQLPLTASDATKDLQPAVQTGVPDRLTAAYVPNMRPTRIWRSTPAGANLGRPDIAGSEPLLDAVDEVYTSWMRDIRLAKARLIVPQSYLQSRGPGRGAVVDLDREVYEAVDALPGQEGMEITPNQFAIRWQEHQATIQDFTMQIVRSAGYSAQTFGMMGDAAVTATEVTARERRSFTTRGRKIVFQKPPLTDILETWMAVDAAIFRSGITPERPNLEYGDSVSEDQKSLAETANLMRQAEAASTDTLVKLLNPEWDDDQVTAEVQRIMDDRPAVIADPLALTPTDDTAEEPPGPPPADVQDPAEQQPEYPT